MRIPPPPQTDTPVPFFNYSILCYTNITQVQAAAVGNYVDQKYYDWRGKPEIEQYLTGVPHGEFTVESYCEQALMDRHGSVQLNRQG